MSYYERDIEGGYFPSARNPRPEENPLFDEDGMFLGNARPQPVMHPITCAGCGDRRFVVGTHEEMVSNQVKLWRMGWRRDPNTQLDYCDKCAPNVM